MKTAQLCISNVKHAQGEMWKAIWMFGFVLQNIILFPLIFVVGLVASIFDSVDFFDYMSGYFDNLFKSYEIIDKEVDKHTAELDTGEAVVLAIVGFILVSILVSMSGIIGGAIVRNYFM